MQALKTNLRLILCKMIKKNRDIFWHVFEASVIVMLYGDRTMNFIV